MKILLIAHGWPLSNFGGLGLYVETIAHGLHQQGHEVNVLTPEIKAVQKPYIKIRNQNWGQHWTLYLPRATNWIDSWSHRESHSLIRTTLKNMNPDVIHIHHLDGLPLDFWSLAPASSIKAITLHDYAIPCARGQLINALQEICLGPDKQRCTNCLGHRLRPHPILASLGERFPNDQLKSAGKKILAPQKTYSQHLGQVNRRLANARRLLHECDLLLSPSMHLKSRMGALRWPEPQYMPLPLLTPIEVHQPPASTPKRLIYSSRIAPSKGLHLVLEAIKNCDKNSLSLTIIGQTESSDLWPNYPDHIRRLIKKRQSEGYQIHDLGFQSHSETVSQLHRHHAFCLPFGQKMPPLLLAKQQQLDFKSSAAKTAELWKCLQKPSVSNPQ